MKNNQKNLNCFEIKRKKYFSVIPESERKYKNLDINVKEKTLCIKIYGFKMQLKENVKLKVFFTKRSN